MNTKGIKFLAVLAVLAMAFAAIAISTGSASTDAEAIDSYEDLKEALVTGGDFKLSGNIEVTAGLFSEQDVTIDLNGYSIANTEADIWVEETGPYAVITVKSGNLVINDSIGTGTIASKANDAFALNMLGGSITINGGTYNGNITAVQADKGTLTINDGTFKIQQLASNVSEDKYRYTINCIDAHYVSGDAQVFIKGGKYLEFNPANNLAEGPATDFTVPGYLVKDKDAQNFYEVVEAVASITIDGVTTYYMTVAAAVEAAESGNTVVVFNNDSISGSVTVAEGVTVENNAEITISGTFTNNGTINNNKAILCTSASNISNTAKGVVKNMGVIGIQYTPATFDLTTPITTYNGGKLIGCTDDDFEIVVETFAAAENSSFTYGDVSGVWTITAVSGTTNVNGAVLNTWKLDIKAGAVVDVPLGCTLTVNGNVTGTGNIFIEEGGFFTKGATASIAEGVTIDYAGKVTPKIETETSNSGIKDLVEAETTSAALITIATASSEETTVAVGTKDVSLNISGVAISKLDFNVASGGSVAINATSAGASYSGTIAAGTQTLKMDGVTGNFTIVPGSIEIDGEIKGGTLTLKNGAELVVKNTLSVSGTGATIEVADGDKATIIVSEDAVATIDADLTISDGITLEVYGKLTGAEDINNNGEVVIYSGAVIDNFNLATQIDVNPVKGADAYGGTWEYKGTNTLYLNDYEGMPYFADFDLTQIILTGDSVLKAEEVVLTDDAYVFKSSAGLTIKNLSGIATLAINVDVKTANDHEITVIDATGKDVAIKGVSVSISVTGDCQEATGISAKDFTIYNVDLDVVVNPTTYTGEISGVWSTGIITIQSSDVHVVAGDYGIVTEIADAENVEITIEASEVVATGSVVGLGTKGDMSVSQSSTVMATALGITPNLKVPAYALVVGDLLENYSHSTINVNSMAVDDVTNYAAIVNTGDAVITGTFDNKTDGTVVNSGTIGVYGTIIVSEGTFNNASTGAVNVFKTGNAQDVASVVWNADKSGKYISSLTIDDDDITQMADGKISLKAKVTITDKDTESAVLSNVFYYGTATVNSSKVITSMNLKAVTYKDGVQYVSAITITSAKVTEKNVYTAVTSGAYVSGEDVISTVGTVKTTTADDAKMTVFATTEALGDLSVAGGVFGNEGTVNIDSALNTKKFLAKGSFVNDGTLNIKADVTIVKGALASDGKITATAGITMTDVDGGLAGLIETSTKNITFTLKGTVLAEFKYTGKYKASSTATEDTEFTVRIGVAGAANGATIKTVDNSATYEPGVFDLAGINSASKEFGVVTLEGKTMLKSDVASKVAIEVKSGTALQVSGTSNVLGVIGVEDGGKFLRWIDGETSTYSYGKAVYVIEFANDGYSYYGNLAFALENAPENAKMTLSSSTVIDKDTAMKAGVELTFATGVKLTIAGKDADNMITFSMGDNAKFIIPTGNDALTFQYATVSADIDYAENCMVLDEVVFNTATASKISATAGTSSVPAGFTIAFDAIKDGEIIFVKGYSYGAVSLGADYDATAKAVKNFAMLGIGTLAESAVAVAPVGDAAYASILIEGTFYINTSTILAIPVKGLGEIVLGDNVEVTSVEKVEQTIAIGNGTDGFILAGVKDYYKAATDTEPAVHTPYKIKSVPKAGTVAAYVQLSGNITAGTVAAVGNVSVLDLDLSKAAVTLVVPEDATLTVAKKGAEGAVSLTATGLVKVAGTINQYTDTTKTFGKIDYQVKYTDGEYTVYTMLETAASKAPAGTNFAIDENMIVTNLTLNTGNTITIASGKALTVNGVLIVGNAPKSLGAADVISGRVNLGNTAYAIVYPGSDISDATFYAGESTTKAAHSNFSIEDVTYCDVYGNNAEFGTISGDKVINKVGVPSIEGYKFTEWNIIVVGAEKVGDSDVEAVGTFAGVYITIKSVPSAVYKINGSTEVILDSLFEVPIGTVVNALPATGYQGATQTWVVDKDMTITATAFEPIPVPPEPTPEPEVGDSGLSLTDILLIVLVILIAIMVVILVLRLNRS